MTTKATMELPSSQQLHSAKSRGRMHRTARTAGPPLIVLSVLLACWYVVTYVVLTQERRFLLPAPHQIVATFFDPATLAELIMGLWRTAQVAFIGLAIAFVIGVSLAVIMSQAKWIERSLYPFVVVLQTVPILAIVPLIGFWAGYAMASRVIVCVIIALFPIVINTLNGLLGTDPLLMDLLKMHGSSRRTRLFKLQLPSAMPDLLVGLRVAAGGAVIGAIVGDFMFGQGEPGIGILLQRYARTLESDKLLAAVLLACGMGVVVFSLFGHLGHRLLGGWSEAWRDR